MEKGRRFTRQITTNKLLLIFLVILLLIFWGVVYLNVFKNSNPKKQTLNKTLTNAEKNSFSFLPINIHNKSVKSAGLVYEINTEIKSIKNSKYAGESGYALETTFHSEKVQGNFFV